MQIKLLNDVLSHIVGRQAGDVINLLTGKKNVNEFIIAKKLKLTINQTRNLLYRLADAGVVSSIRKKDKRKGWYTYFWTLNIGKSLELLAGNVSKELESLKGQLKSRENKRYYVCNTCKTEVNEENALLHSFICTECGEVYQLQEDKKILSELANKIKKVEGNLSIIHEEIAKLREKESKKLARSEKRAGKKPKKKPKKANNPVKKRNKKKI